MSSALLGGALVHEVPVRLPQPSRLKLEQSCTHRLRSREVEDVAPLETPEVLACFLCVWYIIATQLESAMLPRSAPAIVLLIRHS